MTVIDLIKLIKPIPKLFIRKHSIFSLEVFIDGWYYRDDKEDVRASVLYTEFYEWLQEKYKVGGSGGWADILYYKMHSYKNQRSPYNSFLYEKIPKHYLLKQNRINWLMALLYKLDINYYKNLYSCLLNMSILLLSLMFSS